MADKLPIYEVIKACDRAAKDVREAVPDGADIRIHLLNDELSAPRVEISIELDTPAGASKGIVYARYDVAKLVDLLAWDTEFTVYILNGLPVKKLAELEK